MRYSSPFLIPGKYQINVAFLYLGFSGSLEVKASACNAGDLGSIPGLGSSPGDGHGNSVQYSLPAESHRQRSLMGYIVFIWHIWFLEDAILRDSSFFMIN